MLTLIHSRGLTFIEGRLENHSAADCIRLWDPKLGLATPRTTQNMKSRHERIWIPSMVTALMQSEYVKVQIKHNVPSCHKYSRPNGQPPQVHGYQFGSFILWNWREEPLFWPHNNLQLMHKWWQFAFPQVHLATPGTWSASSKIPLLYS